MKPTIEEIKKIIPYGIRESCSCELGIDIRGFIGERGIEKLIENYAFFLHSDGSLHIETRKSKLILLDQNDVTEFVSERLPEMKDSE